MHIHIVAVLTMPVHTYCSSIDHACTCWTSYALQFALQFLGLLSLLRALYWSSYAWQFALLVARALAALTSLFLDAFLVVSGLLPWNTWSHGQASFLT